jgi:hypothetical protein
MHFMLSLGETKHFGTTQFARRAFALLAVVGCTTACSSSSEPRRPTPSIDTAPPRTAEILPTVALTTTSTSLPPAPTSIPTTTKSLTASTYGPIPDDPESQAIIAAFRSSEAAFRSQLRSGKPNEVELREFMTDEVAKISADLITQAVQGGKRRFVQGTIDDSLIIFFDYTPGNPVALVRRCVRNNAAEFDTQRTETTADDVLIQDNLEVSALDTYMAKEPDGSWKTALSFPLKESECDGFFS